MNQFEKGIYVIVKNDNNYEIAKIEEVVYENTHGWGIFDPNVKSVIEKLSEPINSAEQIVYKYLVRLCKESILIKMDENELIPIANILSLTIRFK